MCDKKFAMLKRIWCLVTVKLAALFLITIQLIFKMLKLLHGCTIQPLFHFKESIMGAHHQIMLDWNAHKKGQKGYSNFGPRNRHLNYFFFFAWMSSAKITFSKKKLIIWYQYDDHVSYGGTSNFGRMLHLHKVFLVK